MDPWLLSSSNSGAAHPCQPGGEGAGHLQQQQAPQLRVAGHLQQQQAQQLRVGDAGAQQQENLRQPKALAGNKDSGNCFAFTDSFVERNGEYCPLPDSAEYINLLESKLRKLSATGSNKNRSSPTAVREQVISNLLRSDSKQILGILTESDLALDRELERNQLISRIIPKQPITVGETVRLVNSDILDQSYSKNLPESPTTATPVDSNEEVARKEENDS